MTYELHIDDLPAECIKDCSHAGDCEADVQRWREVLKFTVDRAKVTPGLLEYGAWEQSDLDAKSDEEISELVLWLACGDFQQWDGTVDSPYGSDLFYLEG